MVKQNKNNKTNKQKAVVAIVFWNDMLREGFKRWA